MIIHDFLDNDLYKFTTMNAIQKKFPDSEVVYRFVNRGNRSPGVCRRFAGRGRRDGRRGAIP